MLLLSLLSEGVVLLLLLSLLSEGVVLLLLLSLLSEGVVLLLSVFVLSSGLGVGVGSGSVYEVFPKTTEPFPVCTEPDPVPPITPFPVKEALVWVAADPPCPPLPIQSSTRTVIASFRSNFASSPR